MLIYGFVLFLIVLAMICPIILPNEKVSDHKRDHV